MQRFLIVLSLLASVVSAQEVHLGGSAGPHPHFSVTLRLPTPGGGSAQAGVAYRAPALQVFGAITEHVAASTISNATLEAAVHASLAGNYHVSFGARGTIGPVAARLGARVYHAPFGTFSAHEQLFPTRPTTTGWGIVASATYRHENLVFVLEPTIDFAQGATYVSLLGDVRWLRAVDRHEVRFRTNLHMYETLSGDVGATLVLNRGRKPAWEVGAFLTLSELGVAPGVHALYHETFAGSTLKVRTAFAPYSTADPTFALEATFTTPFETGTLAWDAALAVGPEVLGVMELRLVLPLP